MGTRLRKSEPAVGVICSSVKSMAMFCGRIVIEHLWGDWLVAHPIYTKPMLVLIFFQTKKYSFFLTGN